MSDDDERVVDFEAAKDRRDTEEIDRDQAHWEAVNQRLFEVMMTSDLSWSSLASATLRALLDALEARYDMPRLDAKKSISSSLNAFQDGAASK